MNIDQEPIATHTNTGRLEAFLFEATVSSLRALLRLAVCSGLTLERAHTVLRLAARALERRS
jgi:hypothetical protein